MAEGMSWYIVLYDISHPKRLRKAFDLLRGWGAPLQYSVFRVRANKRDFERLRCELVRIIDLREDRILSLRLGPSSEGIFICDGRQTGDPSTENLLYKLL